MKEQDLNDLARNLVGDGQEPNIYFVSSGDQVLTVTLDFGTAYEQWQHLAEKKDKTSCLEDRLTGVLASVEPQSDNSPILVKYDIDPRWRKPA